MKTLIVCFTLVLCNVGYALQNDDDSRLRLQKIEKLECNVIDEGLIVARRVIEEDINFTDAYRRETSGQLTENDKAKKFKTKTGTVRMDLRYQTLVYSSVPGKSHVDEGVAVFITFMPNDSFENSITTKGFLRDLDDYIQLDGPDVGVNCRIYRTSRDGIKNARGWY